MADGGVGYHWCRYARSYWLSYCHQPPVCRKVRGFSLESNQCFVGFKASIKTKVLHRWLSGKESACQAGDARLIPGSGQSIGEGNGNPLQYSCLGNPVDRGVWWALVHGGCKRVGHDLAMKQQHKNKNPSHFQFSKFNSSIIFSCNHSGTTFFSSGRCRLFISHVLMFGHAYQCYPVCGNV